MSIGWRQQLLLNKKRLIKKQSATIASLYCYLQFLESFPGPNTKYIYRQHKRQTMMDSLETYLIITKNIFQKPKPLKILKTKYR